MQRKKEIKRERKRLADIDGNLNMSRRYRAYVHTLLDIPQCSRSVLFMAIWMVTITI